jgi:putative PIN family toxin of toxin-antitoxin system
MLFYRWVMDPNILISYVISSRLAEVPLLIDKYNLEFCCNDNLVTEFADVLSRDRIRKYLTNDVAYYVEIASKFLSNYPTQVHFDGSPDKDDDYLVDIVQQTNSVGLITGDKALLQWSNSPIQIISWRDFQLTFPL